MNRIISILKQPQIITLVLVFLFFSNLSANPISISGTVINSDTKTTLPGVSVFAKNTVIGTSTDINGKFLLKNIPADSAIIVFSFVGFETQEIKFSNNCSENIKIELHPSAILLEEVVISTAKNQLTSYEQTTPVSVVTQENITEHATQDISDIIIRQPSVSLVGAGFHRAPSIRGLARKRVVVMVDGERISSERNPGPPGTFVSSSIS